jgi:CDP-4-dehydro-6-deoxyglucose reductase
MQQLIFKLFHFKVLAPTLIQVFLLPEQEKLAYQAGQYLELFYPDGSCQPFSIANTQQANGVIELHIRNLSNDAATTGMLRSLREEKIIKIRGPMGDAIYKTQPNNPVILMAGGTGFAYIKAIIEQAIASEDQRLFHLYWGVKTQQDFYLSKLLYQWQKRLLHFSYTQVVSQNENWQGRKGYLHHAVLEDFPNLSEYQIYISGPLPMVKTSYEIFTQHGLEKSRIYSDLLT